ncbi:helix-turn-helix domain-containing protein [Mycobacterium sp. M26]|uniref:PucR family transcriptional regulator n=1 Tax=Mycobacterium sp. M26 TaxID=1762962 RepID=UPI00073F0EDF|nr:helix-turn-helix domain-containing protein [Mycobacterium sp. M26]
MDPEWAPIRDDVAAQRVWQTVLRPIAADLLEQSEQLAEDVLDRIRAEQPQLMPDSLFIEGQPAGIESSIRQFAQIVADGADPRELDLPAEAIALGRARVQQRVPLAFLIRSYRLGQDTLWEWLFGRIIASASDAGQQAAALQLTTSWLFAYIDSSLALTEEIYETQREAWLRSAAAARTTAIDDVLSERERDAQRAAKKLRYDLNRQHVGVAVWLDATPEDSDAQQILAEVCTALSRAVSAESTLTQPVGPLSISAWLSRREAFDPALLDPVAIARSAALPSGVRVAVGDPRFGLKGFRGSHSEASQARRVATLSRSRAAAVTRYRDVALAALASVDAEQAVAFAHRVLGPLAEDDEATYRVAMTLAVYLQENRSPARAAQRLTVHPNTVSYRVNQAETILGRDIDADALEVSVALALLPLLPGLTAEL